jgi:Holliday junction resolvase RusA-like endonuclease
MGCVKPMAEKRKLKEEREYEEKYGSIPEDTLEYLRTNLKLDHEKIETEIERIENLEWNEIIINLPMIPKASHRPRYDFINKHFYVKSANYNKKVIDKFLKKNDIIFTNIIFTLDVYQPTPTSSMNSTEIYLAELKHIRWSSLKDFDNLAKTYSDMLQDVLILNDNLIVSAVINKYFSIRPRIEISIKYQNGFDSKYNFNRIVKSKIFLDKGLIPVETYEGIPY